MEINYQPILTALEFSYWKDHYSKYNIRYYWKENTYFNIIVNDTIAGVCGLHQLRRQGHYLMRGDFIHEKYRKSFEHLQEESLHSNSIAFRLQLARASGAKTIWVRCNKNSINNYKKHGFKVIRPVETQYVPLCLKIAI